jgi:hypothetical protein
MVLKVCKRTIDPEVEVWRRSSWDVFGDQTVSFLSGVVIMCPLF